MSRDIMLYLEDIQVSCERILRYVGEMNFSSFKNDTRTYDAVVRNLEIIGEAVKNIDESFRRKYPDVEWRAIAALRNIVAHEYFGIKDEIIWDIIIHKIPTLFQQINTILRKTQ